MSIEIENDPHAHCTTFRQFDYVLLWRPERDYVAGTRIELRSHCLRAFHAWEIARTAFQEGDITFRWKRNATASEMRKNMSFVIMRATLHYGARRGRRLKIHVTAIPPIWSGIDNEISVWIMDVTNNFRADLPQPDPVREEGSVCRMTVQAGPVERLSVRCHPVPDADGKVRSCLVPEDRFGNPSAFRSPVPVELAWEGGEWVEDLQATRILRLDGPERVGRLRASVPMRRLARTENVANGERRGEFLVVTGNPVWANGAGDLEVRRGEALVAHVRLSAEDSIQTLEIVSEGRVVWDAGFSEWDVEFDAPLGDAKISTHFYLRALQRNGGIIYASPVFVGVVSEEMIGSR